MIVPAYHLEDFQALVQKRGMEVESSGLLTLRTWSWESGKTKAARVLSMEYWTGAMQRGSFGFLQRVPSSILHLHVKKLSKPRKRTIWKKKKSEGIARLKHLIIHRALSREVSRFNSEEWWFWTSKRQDTKGSDC